MRSNNDEPMTISVTNSTYNDSTHYCDMTTHIDQTPHPIDNYRHISTTLDHLPVEEFSIMFE